MFLKILGGGQLPGCLLWLRAWHSLFGFNGKVRIYPSNILFPSSRIPWHILPTFYCESQECFHLAVEKPGSWDCLSLNLCKKIFSNKNIARLWKSKLVNRYWTHHYNVRFGLSAYQQCFFGSWAQGGERLTKLLWMIWKFIFRILILYIRLNIRHCLDLQRRFS